MLNVVFEECTKRNMMYHVECLEHGVICIGYAFDVGNIRAKDLIYERRKTLLELELNRYDDKQLYDILRKQKDDMDILLKTIRTGGEIRIWRSSEPHNICAFLFLCDIICDYNINAYCVDLPSNYSSWAFLQGRMYSCMQSNSYLLPHDEITAYRNRWKTLQKENAPLRAIVDGEVTSVSEEFYDDIIKQNITCECSIGQVLRNITRSNNSSASYGWLALRIKTMIDAGKIKVVYMCKQNFFKTIIKLAA